MIRMLPVLVILVGIHLSAAERIPADQLEFFEKRIRPVLAQECYECHSTTTKTKGGLALDHRSVLLEGGNSGAAVVPGKPKDSLLLQSIRHDDPELKMPKNGAKLDARVIQDFEAWIAMGAPDPRDRAPSAEDIARDTAFSSVLERRKLWWSFQPIQNPAVPVPKNASWSDHPVDRFLLAAMEQHNLQPSADAEPRTLLRRLNLLLIGLPPSPEEVEAFVAAHARDPRNAIAAVVDRLLASPRFGERWARHWMDWIRYAETHGSEGDPAIPYAWRYRDYLIRALNADVPYPQLVREHIAGDLLEQPRIDRTAGINESAIGAAHLRMVPHGYSPTDSLDELVTSTDNQIDTVSKAFLGITVSCARCHDHKFDAISQADFYALYGIFTSSRPATIDVNLPERQRLHVETLTAQKQKLRTTLAEEWLKASDTVAARLREWKPDAKKILHDGPLAAWARLAPLPPEKWAGEWQRMLDQKADYAKRHAAFRAQPVILRWDLRGDDLAQWTADGAGAQGPSKAGEFTLHPSGPSVLAAIYPAGMYSNRITTKHRAVLASPRFKADGGKLWVRARGQKTRVRYVVQNYPRSGTIHLKHDLGNDADEWVGWNLDYWKGDSLHFEIATDADQPVETSNAERSWFGATDVVYLRDPNAPAPPANSAALTVLVTDKAPQNLEDLTALYSAALKRSLENWRAGTLSDDEADFLNAFVRQGWLPNQLTELPALEAPLAEFRRLEAEIPLPTRAPGVLEGAASNQPLFTRGDHKKPAQEVPRRFLDAVDPAPYALDSRRSGRRQLAESILDPRNPLAARVIVNRVWQYVYGTGLVVTPDNFGRLGDPPSHPELLNYLAHRFQSGNGSLKDLIRVLVTSRVMTLDHRASRDAAERDPANTWLTHFSARRVEAEVVRDSMLQLTGKLEASASGPSVDGGAYKRSIYVRVIRNNLDPLLSAFDFPVPTAPRGRRDATNVPAQSLALMNAPLVQRWAGDWAQRLLADRNLDDATRLQRLFQEAYGRMPSPGDLQLAHAYLAEQAASAASVRAELSAAEEQLAALKAALPPSKDPKEKPPAAVAAKEEEVRELREWLKTAESPAHGWRSLALSLLNTKEFIYVR